MKIYMKIYETPGPWAHGPMGPGPKGQSAQRAPWDPQGRPPWDPTGPKNAFLGPLGPKKCSFYKKYMLNYF